MKLIYGADPEFRRNVEKAIEVYPKSFKIYTRFHLDRIEFDEEKVCELSNAVPLNSLLAKALDLPLPHLHSLRVFFKTCSMFKWEELPDLTLRTAEVSSEQTIFLAVVEAGEAAAFEEANCVAAE